MAEKKGVEPATPTPAEPAAEEIKPEVKNEEDQEQSVAFWKAKASAAEKEAKRVADKLTKRIDEFEAKERNRAEAEMSEVEKLKAKLAENERLRAEAERKALRQKVAAEVGLATIFAERLQGDDEDTMREDAKKMLEALPKQETKKPAQPIVNPTNPAGASVKETEADMRKRLHLDDVTNIWSPLEGGLPNLDNKE
jgi:hypothetical protein